MERISLACFPKKTINKLTNVVVDYQMPGVCRAFKTKFIIFGQLNQNVS